MLKEVWVDNSIRSFIGIFKLLLGHDMLKMKKENNNKKEKEKSF